MQLNCSHSLWYLLSHNTDSYESKPYWTCKCVKCCKIEEDLSRNFENVIVGDGIFALHERSKYSYNEVRREYNNLINNLGVDGETNINGNDIVKVLVKRYNPR